MKRFFWLIFLLLLSIALYSAAPLPTAQATNDVPEGLTPADWAQIQNQLDPAPPTSLTEQAKLTASDAAAEDRFGYSVAVNGDTAVIGTPMDDDRGIESGSVYVFIRSGEGWSQQAKLTASDSAGGDQFGTSVAVSGDTAVVGVRFDDDGHTDSGSAYVFTRTNGEWSQQAKLTASDLAESDYFGISVAVSDDTAIIGAFADDDGGDASGSAYVFTRTGGTWSQQAKLTASDSTEFDNFGWSVATSGDTAVIGAYGDDDEGEASGSAYVFTRTGEVWSQQAKLIASDSAEDDHFGYSVAVSGDTAVIGAYGDDDGAGNSGSAYLFTRSGGMWSEPVKLTASDSAMGDLFGTSVAVSGDTALIGAYGDDDGRGSVYFFTRTGGTWSQQAKLTASDTASHHTFGIAVAVGGDTAIIGAWQDGEMGYQSGSAYAFTLTYPLTGTPSGTGSENVASPPTTTNDVSEGLTPAESVEGDPAPNSWHQQAKLTINDAITYDQFGWSVAVSGDTAVIGVPFDDDAGEDSGSAYVFIYNDGVWSRQAKLTASDSVSGDYFGYSVAVSGDTTVIGAYRDNSDRGMASGSAYVFVRSGGVWNQQAKLTASDSAEADGFGYAVAVGGGTAVIGAYGDDNAGRDSGSAYVFIRTEQVWSQQAKLTANDLSEDDQFGWSVAVHSDTALIGAYRDDDGGLESGSAYVFIRTGGVWSEQAKLTASDGTVSGYFGWSLAISGDTALIGAPLDVNGGINSGSAYVFTRTGRAWSQQAKLTAGDSAADVWFGRSVAVSDDTAVIGAYHDADGGKESGSAYVFTRTDGVWSQQAKLTAKDSAAFDWFGYSVAVSSNTVVIGAHQDDDRNIQSGSVYIYTLLLNPPYLQKIYQWFIMQVGN